MHRRRRRRGPRPDPAAAGRASRPARRPGGWRRSGGRAMPEVAARSAWAASTKNRATPSGPGWSEHVVVPAGLRDAGPVSAGLRRAGGASTAPSVDARPSPCGRPRSVRTSARPMAAVVASRSRAGTCQAPHTTATSVDDPSRRRRGSPVRMCASRRRLATRRRRVPARTAAIASATASNGRRGRRRGARSRRPTSARRRGRRPRRPARSGSGRAARRSAVSRRGLRRSGAASERDRERQVDGSGPGTLVRVGPARSPATPGLNDGQRSERRRGAARSTT